MRLSCLYIRTVVVFGYISIIRILLSSIRMLRFKLIIYELMRLM